MTSNYIIYSWKMFLFYFQLIVMIRKAFGKRNVSKKTMVDDRFLIWSIHIIYIILDCFRVYMLLESMTASTCHLRGILDDILSMFPSRPSQQLCVPIKARLFFIIFNYLTYIVVPSIKLFVYCIANRVWLNVYIKIFCWTNSDKKKPSTQWIN